MAKSSIVPIYVYSDQWVKMHPDDLPSLTKTILYSFRHFDAPIGWMEGYEDEFLLVCLKARIFRVIFDGLDEYVLKNQGKVDATETVAALLSLAQRTGAGIVVTSRTTFWESEVADLPSVQPTSHPPVLFRMQPFDTIHAKQYFESRFANAEAEVKGSVRLFDHLKQQSTGTGVNLIGRGFFLYLIADLIARGYLFQHRNTEGLTATQWIVTALCDRENKRQLIPKTFPAKLQVAVLREIALMVAKGEMADSATLRTIIELITGIKGLELDDLVGSADGKRRGKLKDHPIIQYAEDKDSWLFRQDQVFFVLLAETLFDVVNDSNRTKELQSFINALRSSSNLQTDVATALVEQIFEISEPAESNEKIKVVITAILGCIDFNLSGDHSQPAAALACTIATLANNREFPPGSGRKEKTAGFIDLLPMRSISGLTFTGAISRFDFSGVTFSKCLFDQVTWIGCNFDASTEFNACQFAGGTTVSCNGLGLGKFSDNCLYDRESMAFVDGEKIRAGSKSYTRGDLKTDMSLLIEKFVSKGGMVFKRVEERNIVRGRFGTSLFRDAIFEASKRFLIQEYNSVALKENLTYQVRSGAKDALVHFSENGIFTGPIKIMFDELTKQLKL